jgi:predicted nucleic acid-binding protein
MAVIVSDTTPLNYLVLIEAVEILPRLYGRVLIPPAVREELRMYFPHFVCQNVTVNGHRDCKIRVPHQLLLHGHQRSYCIKQRSLCLT